jgi:hypothetical protein
MIEVSYEISHSGNNEQSPRFSKELPQVFPGAYRGPYERFSGDTTFRRRTDTRQSVEAWVAKLDEWVCEWANAFENSNISYYLERQPTRGRPGAIFYGAARNGSITVAGKIIGHKDLSSKFPERDCHCSRPQYSYPDTAPYADCPARENPPTLWAVNAFIHASANL